jgi:hypothetical protein
MSSAARDGFDRLREAGVVSLGPDAEALRAIFADLTEDEDDEDDEDDEIALIIRLDERIMSVLPEVETHVPVAGGALY